MDVIARHLVMPDDGIEMDIMLDDGVAIVELNGNTVMPCWCGAAHRYGVSATLRCDSHMDRIDMDDLDAAIRGENSPARRFAWRLMNRMFFVETPPCERERK